MTDTATPSPSPQPEDTHRFPCDQCGADYRFQPGENALICDHCGNSAAISSGPWGGSALRELDLDAALNQRLPEAEIELTRVLNCPNCAAQVEFDPDTHAAECPFCATPVVTDTGTHRHIKPRGVLPFQLDERTAHKAMSDWLGGLWFAPNGLQAYARKGRKMQGIYVPYWTFDANTKSQYRGERGTVYYETRTVTRNGKREQQRVAKVRWRTVSGRVARFFDDVLILAATSLPKRYTDQLAPWDLAALEPYQPEFLAGLRAQGYTVALGDGFTEARAQMERTIERDVRFDIGGDRQRIHDIDTDMRDITFKHILLPVWLAAYKYRGKSYRFVINGQSGRVQGERPWSAIKIAIAVVLGAVVAAGVGYVIASNQ
ncbi:MAG: primosomal protein N' (replication factor Y) - superfamily II helicase [Sedimentitalea sp.]